jgi:molybdopterin-guanine dinucleotide biosynthesis protein B
VSRNSARTEKYKPSQTPDPVTALKVIAIAGFANCGKTELIGKLIGLATQRGFQVAAIKHSHKTLEVDKPGKDTWRLRQAGARTVALAAPGLLQVIYFPPEDLPPQAVLAALPGTADFVLVEGYKHGPWPKIVFLPPPAPGASLPDYENIIAYISDAAVDTALPVFSREQAPEILDFILQWLKI